MSLPYSYRLLPRNYEYRAQFKDLVATSYESPCLSPFVPGAEAKAIAKERQKKLDCYLLQLPGQEVYDTALECSSTEAESEDAESVFTESDNESTATTVADPDDVALIQFSEMLKHCATLRIKRQWWALNSLAEDLPLSKIYWICAQVKLSCTEVSVGDRKLLEDHACCECGVFGNIHSEQRPCASCNKKICKCCSVPYIPKVLNSLVGATRDYENTLRRIILSRRFVGRCKDKSCQCRVMTMRADFQRLCQCESDFTRAEQQTVEIGRFCRDCVNKEIVLPSNQVLCQPWLRRLCPFGRMEDTNDRITPYCRICLKHGILPGYPTPQEWTPDPVPRPAVWL
jgi:hypothetical protein